MSGNTPAQKYIVCGNTMDLMSSSVGGHVIYATDDFFSPAERAISPDSPLWDETRFTAYGKWMDGWETRRKRTLGHDWAIFQLGVPGTVSSFDLDTAYFTGNQTPYISIEATCLLEKDDPKDVVKKLRALRKVRPDNAADKPKDTDISSDEWIRLGTHATNEENSLAAEALSLSKWVQLIPKSRLLPGYEETRHHAVDVSEELRNTVFTHIKVNYFPDGGVARIRAMGVAHIVRDNRKDGGDIEVSASTNGGRAIASSNTHYGVPSNLIVPGVAKNMAGGWETARNPNRPNVYVLGDDGHIEMPGFDWSILQLCGRSTLTRCVVDTTHFKGNYPESFILEGVDISNQMKSKMTNAEVMQELEKVADKWTTIVARTKLGPNAQAEFTVEDKNAKYTHVRITIYPDGGVSRLRIYGKPEVSGPN